MAYTFADIQTEFFARGFSYLNDGAAGATRANQWINDGYQALCEEAAWPFLEATTTGAAPLTITDLREILYVVDTVQQLRLRQADARDIVDVDPLVTTAGTPSVYWLDGLTTLKVWQTNTTNSLSVRYIKIPTDLSSGTDVPVVPARYRNLLVDYAVHRALQDSSNFLEADILGGMMGVELDRMKSTLLDRAGDDTDFIVQTQWYEMGGR